MTVRLLQTALLAIVSLAAWVTWRDLPERQVFTVDELAHMALQTVFGDDVISGEIHLDLVDGVRLEHLHVPSRSGQWIERDDGTIAEGFDAVEVEVGHDILALAAGHIEVRRLRLEGAILVLQETEDGLELDFPFDLVDDDAPSASAPVPAILVSDAYVFFRARPGSTRLAEGQHLAAYVETISADLTPDRGLLVDGRVRTLGIGQDDEVIRVSGVTDPVTEEMDILAEWTRLAITEDLLGVLAPELATPLRQKSIRSGRLQVRIQSAGLEDTIHLRVDWDADVEVQVEDIPGIEKIDANTKEQLQELFGQGVLKLSLDDDVVNIESLVSQMAGGYVRASGTVTPETGELDLEFRILDLELSDPAVRRALGEDGAVLFDQFRPSGVVDAHGTVKRAKDGEVEWEVTVELDGASFEYVGSANEEGRPEGFPYRVHGAKGQIRIRPDGVFFSDIQGYHRGTDILFRGDHREAWTGGPTGRILFTPDGPDIRLTIEAIGLAIDEDVHTAVDGSEFNDIWDEFRLSGTVDRAVLDIISEPGFDDAAVVEFRLELAGEQFAYLPFPFQFEDVIGTIEMRRPKLDALGEHGNVYSVDVRGWAEGAPVTVTGTIESHLERGMLHVEGVGLPLGGGLTEAILSAEVTAGDLAEAWQWLAPRGRAAVALDLPIDEDPRPLRVTADFDDASFRLGAVLERGGEIQRNADAIDVDHLTGRLTYDAGRLAVTNALGRIGDSAVTLSGEMDGGTDGDWHLHLQTEDLFLSRRLLAGLRSLVPDDKLFPGGLRLEPGGQVALDLRLDHAADGGEIEEHVVLERLDLLVSTAELSGIEIVGERIEIGAKWVDLVGVTARGPRLDVDVPKARIPKTDDGEIEGRFVVRMQAFTLTPELARLLPEDVGSGLADLSAGRLLSTDDAGLEVDAPGTGTVTLRGSIEFAALEDEPLGDAPIGTVRLDPLSIRADPAGPLLAGVVRLEDFDLDVGLELKGLTGTVAIDRLRLGDDPSGSGRLVDVAGRVLDIGVDGISAPLLWEDGIFRMDPITGHAAGGALTADFRIHTREPMAYEGSVRIDRFDVARVKADLAPTGAPVTGIGTAQLTFQNRGGGVEHLTGAGSLQIRHGNLGELPGVANIFAFFAAALETQDRPTFERADLAFRLSDEVFTFSRVSLSGPLFDMHGAGTIDLAGVANLRFTPHFITSMLLPGALQLPVIGDALNAIVREEILYDIRVRGALESASVDLIPIPWTGIDFGDSFEGTGPRELPRRQVPRWFR